MNERTNETELNEFIDKHKRLLLELRYVETEFDVAESSSLLDNYLGSIDVQCSADFKKYLLWACEIVERKNLKNAELNKETIERAIERLPIKNKGKIDRKKKNDEEIIKEEQIRQSKVRSYVDKLFSCFINIVEKICNNADNLSSEELIEYTLAMRYLDIIEGFKYYRIGINLNTVQYASLINGFSFKPYLEIMERLNYLNEEDEIYGYDDGCLSIDMKENDIESVKRFYKNINNNVSSKNINQLVLNAGIVRKEKLVDDEEDGEEDNNSLCVSYSSLLGNGNRKKIAETTNSCLKIKIREYDSIKYYEYRKLRITSGKNSGYNINVYDVVPYLAMFLFSCSHYDVNHYPFMTPRKRVMPISAYEEEKFEEQDCHKEYSLKRYIDLLRKTWDLVDSAAKKCYSDKSKSVKMAVNMQLLKLDEMFGLLKTVKLYEHYKLLTSDDVIDNLCIIFPIYRREEIRNVIENLIFNNALLMRKIYESTLPDPFVLFEYVFLCKVFEYINTREFLNDSDQILEKIIMVSQEKIIKYYENPVIPDELREKYFARGYNDLLNYDIYNKNNKVDLMKTETNSIYKLVSEKSAVFNWNDDHFDYDGLTSFIKDHSLYEVIKSHIDCLHSDKE